MSLWCKYTAMTRKASWELNQHTRQVGIVCRGGGFREKKKNGTLTGWSLNPTLPLTLLKQFWDAFFFFPAKIILLEN